ncbi:hypothetical protein OAO87_04465 [bacterium]|nr:hypothetical protein [bacterium]
MHACARACSVAANVGVAIHVAGKSAGSTRNRRARLEEGLRHELQRRRIAAPFPGQPSLTRRLRCCSSTTTRVLLLLYYYYYYYYYYDTWTKISTEHALPTEARVWGGGTCFVPMEQEHALMDTCST